MNLQLEAIKSHHTSPNPGIGSGSAPDGDNEGMQGVVERAAELAETIMARSAQLETRSERRARKRFARLLSDAGGGTFLTLMLDRALRPEDPRRVVALVASALDRDLGFMTADQRTLLNGFRRLGPLAPQIAVPLFERRIRAEASRYVLNASPRNLRRYLAKRSDEGVTVNLNLVGEAVLGNDEGRVRLDRYEAALRSPDIEAIAVKISSISAGVHPLAFGPVVDNASAAMRRLYRAARPNKIVTLDMEAYEDLDPTLAAFERVLTEDEFLNDVHGIALQSYLPDTVGALETVRRVGAERMTRGGKPVRVRLAKGANPARGHMKTHPH